MFRNIYTYILIICILLNISMNNHDKIFCHTRFYEHMFTVHLSKCWRGTCSFVGMLKGYIGNKRLGTPALKVRSIKICRSLLRVLHNDCACSYFRRKSLQWHGIAWCMLGWREHYCNFDSGDKQKCHGYIFEKTHGIRQLYITFFFAVLNSSIQIIQIPKNQTHCTYI